MTPKQLMIIGSSFSIVFFILGVFAIRDDSSLSGSFMFLMFMLGMLFGKGYGIWEERGRDGK
jgi:hypothetical protein